MQTILKHTSDQIPVPTGQSDPSDTTYDNSKQHSLAATSEGGSRSNTSLRSHSALAQEQLTSTEHLLCAWPPAKTH